MDRTELLPDGSRRDQMISDGVVLVGLANVPWVFLYGNPLVASLVSTAALVGLAFRISRIDVRRLVLGPAELIVEQRSGHFSIALDRVTEVGTEWVPQGPTICHIRSRDGHEVEMRVTEEAEEFLAELGKRLEPHRRQVHAKPSACALLGWPDRPTQMD